MILAALIIIIIQQHSELTDYLYALFVLAILSTIIIKRSSQPTSDTQDGPQED